MVETGWKTPSNIKQDSRKKLNNGHMCYAFHDLKDITRDDMHYAYIPTSGGITNIHRSPAIYTSNYGFNIPATATIKRVGVKIVCQQMTDPKRKYNRGGKLCGHSISKYETIKLKTGTSTTDLGVGNNKAGTAKLPYKKWTTDAEATHWYTVQEWGVTLTPDVINSSNFGAVTQFIGTEKNGWCMPSVAKIQINVEYELVETKKVVTTTTNTPVREIKLKHCSFVNPQDFDLNSPNAGQTVKLVWTHKGEGCSSPIVSVSTKHMRLGNSKVQMITLPVLQFKTSDTIKEYSQTFLVYPGNVVGTFEISVTANGGVTKLTCNVINTKVPSQSSNSSIGVNDRITDNAAYKNTIDNQRILIQNCSITNNVANRGGGVYITGEHYDFIRTGVSNNTPENLVINWQVRG